MYLFFMYASCLFLHLYVERPFTLRYASRTQDFTPDAPSRSFVLHHSSGTASKTNVSILITYLYFGYLYIRLFRVAIYRSLQMNLLTKFHVTTECTTVPIGSLEIGQPYIVRAERVESQYGPSVAFPLNETTVKGRVPT
jgi:hypothetical protein